MKTESTITQEVREARFWHRISVKEKALFYEHLANMVDGGVPVIAALHSFLDKNRNVKIDIEITNLLVFVESGDSFSIAMKKLPSIFDKREVAIIEAGEQSGTMQHSFVSLANELRNQEELKSKVKGALTYPFIIVLFLVGAVMTIMTYIIPKLEPLFMNTGVELPFATQALISTSRFIQGNFWGIIILIIVGILSFQAYAKSVIGRRSLDALYLNIPVVGDVYRNYIIVRIASTLSLLLEAGIPIIRTLGLTGEGSNNIIFQEKIEAVSKNVQNGKKIAESIEDADPDFRVFTQDFYQIIGAGERTSTINKVCRKLATQYTREVDSSIAVLVRFIEPLAILIAGIFVLWFAFGIFSAVLKITETVS
ncbi:MAG: type II secretion system F family protein [Candidatus Gracilibacteria bacterium]|nr:type II secretion system F family protein [Candidatus Gracilibacteria bacterium]